MTGDTAADYNYFDPKQIENSDILYLYVDYEATTRATYAVYRLWVNDTQLSDAFHQKLTAINSASSFPFPRLAGFSPFNSTNFFLYHQLNETAFAEGQWDSHAGDWVSINFTISPS